MPKSKKKTKTPAPKAAPKKRTHIVPEEELCRAENCYKDPLPGTDFCGDHTVQAMQAAIEKSEAATETRKAKAKRSKLSQPILPHGTLDAARAIGDAERAEQSSQKAKRTAIIGPNRSSRELTQPLVAQLLEAGWTIAAITRAIGMPSAGPVHNWKTGKAGATGENLAKLKALVGTPPPAPVKREPATHTGSITIKSASQAAKLAKLIGCKAEELEAAGQLRFSF